MTKNLIHTEKDGASASAEGKAERRTAPAGGVVPAPSEEGALAPGSKKSGNEKDSREKLFEDFDDVFADIINTLVFHGQDRVAESDLESGMPRSAYKVEDRFEEQERDVKKYWRSGRIRIAVFGLENQTGEDPDFIFRDIGYDGAEYRDQVRRRNEIRRRNAKLRKEGAEESEMEPVPDFYPVSTLVLYFGDTRWRGSLNLKDHLRIPAGMEGYVSDYRANLFEIAFLTDEQVRMFKSDFRYVAEYFVGSRKKKEGIEPSFTLTVEHLKHVEEFIELMNAITNSDRFSALPKMINERGGDTMMTILFDEAEARGKKIGEKNGETKVADLFSKLFDAGRVADAERASKDGEYRDKLLAEYAKDMDSHAAKQ